MPRFAEVGRPSLQVSRFETWLRRLLSIKGSGILQSVSPLVQVGFDPSNADITADLLVSLGWRTYCGSSAVAAVAGQNSGWALQNPAGSGLIGVVWDARATLTAVGQINIRAFDAVGTPGMAGLTPGTYDSRLITKGNLNGVASSGIFFQQGASAAFTAGRTLAGAQGVITATSVSLPRPYVLAPGTCLLIDGGVVNVGGAGGFIWMERAAEGSELVAY